MPWTRTTKARRDSLFASHSLDSMTSVFTCVCVCWERFCLPTSNCVCIRSSRKHSSPAERAQCRLDEESINTKTYTPHQLCQQLRQKQSCSVTNWNNNNTTLPLLILQKHNVTAIDSTKTIFITASIYSLARIFNGRQTTIDQFKFIFEKFYASGAFIASTVQSAFIHEH